MFVCGQVYFVRRHSQNYTTLTRGRQVLWRHRSVFHSAENPAQAGFSVVCGPDRFRTGYLLIANEALYQLSYGPVCVSVSFLFNNLKLIFATDEIKIIL